MLRTSSIVGISLPPELSDHHMPMYSLPGANGHRYWITRNSDGLHAMELTLPDMHLRPIYLRPSEPEDVTSKHASPYYVYACRDHTTLLAIPTTRMRSMLLIDTNTGTSVEFGAELLSNQDMKFGFGVCTDNDTVVLPPYNARSIAVVKPNQASVQLIGRFPKKSFYSAAYVNGKVYCIPSYADLVAEVDVNNSRVDRLTDISRIADVSHRDMGKWVWSIRTPNGNALSFPMSELPILEINGSDGAISTFGNPKSVPNGKSYTAVTKACNGRIYFVHCDCQYLVSVCPFQRSLTRYLLRSNVSSQPSSCDFRMWITTGNKIFALEVDTDTASEPVTIKEHVNSALLSLSNCFHSYTNE